MAEIRCPMCGKSNPDNLDVCQHCQARLKPLIASSTADDSTGADFGLPDWIKSDFEKESPLNVQDEAEDALARLGRDDDSEPQAETPMEDASEGEDFLARLRIDEDSEPQPELVPDAPAEPDSEDWLKRIRDLSAEDSETVDEDASTAISQGSIPEWMLEEEREKVPEDESPAPADDGIPDWLKTTEEPQFDFSEEKPAAESALPDWLTKPDSSEKEQPPTVEPQAAAQTALPESDADLPDWLLSDEINAPPETPDLSAETPTDLPDMDAELPDWFASDDSDAPLEPTSLLGDTPTALTETDAELLDWFASDNSDAPPEPESKSPIVLPESDAELPDWFANDDSESPSAAQAALPETEGELPDWLFSDGSKAPPAPIDLPDIPIEIPSVEAALPETEGELPDWLLSDDSKTPSAPIDLPDIPTETPSAEAEIPESDSDLPEWLLSDDSDLPPETTEKSSEYAAATPEVETDLPDWLTDSPEEIPSTPSSETEDSPLPDWVETPSADISPGVSSSPDDSTDDDIPDWLSGLDEEDIEIPIILPDPEPEIPDWQAGEQAAKLSWPDETEATIYGEGTEPDWLQKLGGDQLPELPDLSADVESLTPGLADDGLDEELFDIEELSDLFSDTQDGEAEAVLDDLAPAELPGWLEAMRPVESDSDRPGEEPRGEKVQTGPLAGLSGVLAAEPEIARLKKSTAFSTKLDVTDAQQKQVKLLRNILETEGVAKPLPPTLEASSYNLLRWIIAFVLFFVVGIVVFSESQIVPSIAQEAVPAEIIKTSQLINALAPQDTVLISFDYEPGTAGEMEAAAAAVVDHLMIKGAYLTLISTSPTGPALAERFITHVQAMHNYTSGNQYINLGYIPGGAAGLLGFAQMPQRITPLSFDGMDAWATAPLGGINALADFKLVLIITDNPDTARTWVEQVEPKLADTPLIAVVSAQAEPIVKPYSSGDKAQIQGIVGGIIDGAAYEQITGKPQLAREYWDALNYGLLTAIGTILLGGIANVITILSKNNKQGEAE